MVNDKKLKRKATEDGGAKKKKKISKGNTPGHSISYSKEKKNRKKISNCIISADLEVSVNSTFSVLDDKICKNTLKAIGEMGFTNMSEIQARSIPLLLEGKDLTASAKSGSGKTLAFLIPILEQMTKICITPRDGTGCIIISPTRELGLQTFGILKELIKYHTFTSCLLIDGSDLKTESRKLSRGCNIVIATPRRLLYHLQNTPTFIYKNLQSLIIDEADRMLEIGFEEDLKKIFGILPKKRQTVLFSNDMTKSEALIALAMRKNPVYLDLKETIKEQKVEGLEQGYVLAPSEKRFLFLLNFLEKNKNKKVVVFFSSCMSTKHHHELLTSLDVPVLSIHGKQKRVKQNAVFSQFCNAPSGILLCAEAAVKDLNFPSVNWILQYDPVEDVEEYIRRLGEIVGGKENATKTMLVLRPEELDFLSCLKEAGISTYEFEVSWSKIKNIQLSLEKLISSNYFLHLSAKEAFKAFVKAYDTHYLKKIFNIETLDLTKIAKSFGFTVPPALDLSTDPESNRQSRPQKRLGGGGYGYFKNINDSSNKKKSQRIKIFKHVGKRKNIRQISK